MNKFKLFVSLIMEKLDNEKLINDSNKLHYLGIKIKINKQIQNKRRAIKKND
jgi:hypothetical protein